MVFVRCATSSASARRRNFARRDPAMAARPRVVVLGAGLAGCALADELTERGWTDVTVRGAAGQAGTPGLGVPDPRGPHADRVGEVHRREVRRSRPRVVL